MMKKVFLPLLVLACVSIQAESFDDFLKNDASDFSTDKKQYAKHKKALEKEFDTYNKVVNEEFNAFKKSLGKFWKDPKVSTKKTWVEYSKDLKSRKVVDFEKNTITLDVHAKNPKEARKALVKSLANTVTKNTKTAFKDDILSQRIEKRMKKVKSAAVDAKPILAPLIFGNRPTSKKVVNYATKKISTRNIKTLRSKVPKLKHYQVTVALPKNSTMKKAAIYLPKAKEASKTYNIPLSVVLGVIQTESGFNPMARSHIPAYGLMQIVPRSAGIDVYHYLYKKRRMLPPSYLYNSNNNIKFGTAYLHIIYSKYLKSIKDPQSRLFCTIAAYNTGAGNVARTFSGTTSPSKASKKINRMSSKQVYNYLIRNLKYHETRDYLKRVTSRAHTFAKYYN